MESITVITPTIGRHSLIKLIESLTKQNVNIVHLTLWDNKREINGYSPNDIRFHKFINENYKIYHYVIEHPIVIDRKDNYLRAIGISMANTPYITQIDDDCWLEENWLSRAINNMITRDVNYCFCMRQLWENENIVLGIDNYESIGMKNKFDYHLIETNSLVFTINIADVIWSITTKNNKYGHDRIIGNYLVNNINGIFDNAFVGLNQIVPDFLLEFHKHEMSLSNAGL